MSKIVISITGPDHYKKTTIAAILIKVLEDHCNINLPVDDQLYNKMDKSLEELLSVIPKDLEIWIMESKTV